MTRIIALAIALMAGSVATASDDSVSGKPTNEVKAQITEMLTAEGYDVRKVETEDGMYEAYALKNGERYEIYLDGDLNIVKTKMDD